MPSENILGRYDGHNHSENAIRGEPMSVRILLVDDNAIIREHLRVLLESHANWEICGQAADGIEAIEKCRQLCLTSWF